MNNNFDIPVVMFVYRRLDTVKLILNQVKEIMPQKLYIFSDGPRNGEDAKVTKLREYIEGFVTWQCDFVFVKADKNKGCASNICGGLNQVFAQEKWAICLEDDAVPRKEFFEYCGELLKRYEGDKRVQYIAGFNAIGEIDWIDTSYTFGMSVPMSGAIALWADRWNECDFGMHTWPEIKKRGEWKKYYYTREMQHLMNNIFEDSYKNVNDGWDYQLGFDRMIKGRVAIVPKVNYVRSYGYTEGAFHPQRKIEVKNLEKVMNVYEGTIELPIKHPDCVQLDRRYDQIRQKILLRVKGNYVSRHLYYARRAIKDIVYRWMPRKLWNFMKRLLK